MSSRSDGSSAPSVSEKIYSMRNEILEYESYSDFSPDDEVNDPNYDPNSKSKLKTFYESAYTIVSPITPNTTKILQLPSNYNSLSSSESPVARKRKRAPELWKQNIRKSLRERGMQFTNKSGNQRPGRAMGSTCSRSCFYICTINISEQQRRAIHSYFWSLTSGEKKIFYGNFVKKEPIKRRRTSEEKDHLKKQAYFHYFFRVDSKAYQICKKYFLSTLAISERTIYYFFAKHYAIDNVEAGLKIDNRGRNATDENQIMEVKNHILSFPTIESHYCRALTSRKYLEGHLSVQKMYDLYKTAVNSPVGIYTYRKVFNTSFNLSFYIPRKDLWDKCQLFRINAAKHSDAEVKMHEKHLEEKRFTTAERDADFRSIDTNAAVLMYDLENVFTLPKMFASSFYYKRKLCVYNLTGILIIPGLEKITYCALWNETLSGRSGNDIASGLIKILSKVVSDHPNLLKLTLWSDSCVPQNRNKIKSTAILQFMHDHPQIREIVQKFSEPGHSSIQQLDSVHSTIEKFLRNVEIPSQLCLIRQLKNANFPNVKLQLLQMNDIDFKCFSIKAESLIFKKVQFFKCKSTIYSNNDYFKVGTKLSFNELECTFFDLRKSKGRFSTTLWENRLRVVPKKTLDSNKKKTYKVAFLS